MISGKESPNMASEQKKPVVHLLWINSGLSCDGDSVALTSVQDQPIFEENPPEKFKGVDIMRSVRSFDPCLPCGVHMLLGNGRVLEKHHSPMAFGNNPL
jgi:Ni,Fe-hydrogenase I large subunit